MEKNENKRKRHWFIEASLLDIRQGARRRMKRERLGSMALAFKAAQVEQHGAGLAQHPLRSADGGADGPACAVDGEFAPVLKLKLQKSRH